jgi:hypothetical protein
MPAAIRRDNRRSRALFNESHSPVCGGRDAEDYFWSIKLPNDKYTLAVIELLTEAARPSGSERVMVVVGGALLEEAVDRIVLYASDSSMIPV